MTTPKGTRCRKIGLVADGCIHVYSNSRGLTLQVRRSVPTEEDILAPSFKVAVPLRPSEAIELAAELLAVVSNDAERLRKEGLE
ncbi:hypothetical protein [Thiocystis violascens]|uniref:Uncharacterized protein n=1 Tax=Thiocystis violascens (strain ATCC 17096 / DSM 198 / 6111) TaxID=765911 RepID=I3Y5H3_THIV6|nr:hypothetical protein [Thiocystis violascens]AFL72241.1 hypothetical protein Thivi_0167 [Thiocystis violascens DSM 198]